MTPTAAANRPVRCHGRSMAASPAPEGTSESGAVNPNVGYYCGTERWPVKTLSDEGRKRVNLKPVPSTVVCGELLILAESVIRHTQDLVRPP